MGDSEAQSESPIEDAGLVARALRGDEASYEQLMRRHFRAAFAVARAHTSSEADAEDVCQSAFFRAYTRLGECRQPDRFASWLLRIVRNQAINAREREDVRVTQPLDESPDATAPAAQRPDEVLERRELRRSLVAALALLTPVQREAIVLHDVEGWNHAEIARMLDISELMARRHVSDGRKRLRATLRSDQRGDISK